MPDSYSKLVHSFNLKRVLSLLVLLTSLLCQDILVAVEVCSAGLEESSRINVYANHHAKEVSEIDGAFTFTRINNLDKQVIVGFELSGTAQKGIDYSLLTEVVVFEAGVSEKTVLFKPVADTSEEGVETIRLEITVGADYTLGNHITDTINIIDGHTALPQLELSASNLSFGEQYVHTRSSGKVISIVANDMNPSNLVLGQLQLSTPFEIANDQCSLATIKPGQSCSFEILFQPDSAKHYESVLSIPNNGANKQVTVSLSGIGQPVSGPDTGNDMASLLTSLVISEGGPECRINQLEWLDVTNSQLLPSPGSGSEFISGYDFVSYQIIKCTAGATLNAVVTYQNTIPENAKFMQYGPTAEDLSPHWYEINPSLFSGNQVVYSLTDGGSGDLDQIANGKIVGQAGLLVPSTVGVAGPVAPALPVRVEVPKLNVSGQSIGFGQQQVFTNSQIRQLEITPANSAALEIGQLEVSQGFKMITDTCSSIVLTQGDQCVVELAFSPTAAHQYTGQLSIPSNDPLGTATVELTGTGRSTDFRSDTDDQHPHAMSVNFSGGGAGCGVNAVNWMNSTETDVLPQPPEFYQYMDSTRIVEFQLDGCDSGSSIQFSIKHSIEIPADAGLMQYGLTMQNGEEQWFELDIDQASDHEQSFSVTDGRIGDLDMAVNGSISVFLALLVPDSQQNQIPAARMSEFDSEILNGIRLSATELSFGRQRLDGKLTTRQLRITSHVKQVFDIGQLVSTENFQISKDLCSNRELAYRKNCSVYVQFVPQTLGDLEGNLSIPVSTINKSIIVPLQGIGRAAKNSAALIDSFGDDQNSELVTELEDRIITPQQQTQTIDSRHRAQGAAYQPIPVFNPVGMMITMLGLLGLAKRSLSRK